MKTHCKQCNNSVYITKNVTLALQSVSFSLQLRPQTHMTPPTKFTNARLLSGQELSAAQIHRSPCTLPRSSHRSFVCRWRWVSAAAAGFPPSLQLFLWFAQPCQLVQCQFQSLFQSSSSLLSASCVRDCVLCVRKINLFNCLII